MIAVFLIFSSFTGADVCAVPAFLSSTSALFCPSAFPAAAFSCTCTLSGVSSANSFGAVSRYSSSFALITVT